MPLVTYLGAVSGIAVLAMMLLRSRAESPAITRVVNPPRWFTTLPWVLLFHPVVPFLAFLLT